MNGPENFVTRELPPLRLMLSDQVCVAVTFNLLPRGFTTLKENIVCNDVLVQYGCVHAFDGSGSSKIYFRRTFRKRQVVPPPCPVAEWRLFCVHTGHSRGCRAPGRELKVLLDTGAHNNFAAEDFLSGERYSPLVPIALCGTGRELRLTVVRPKAFSGFDLLVGRQFFGTYKAVIDFGRFEFYFQVDGIQYMMPIGTETTTVLRMSFC